MVLPCNWDAVQMFLRCSTQWNYGAMGGLIGLNYPGVESVLRITEPKAKHKALFEALQIMERAARKAANQKDQAEA